MRNLAEIRDILSKHKEYLIEKYDLKFVAVFGSYGRGETQKGSDVDILVDFKNPVGIEFIDLANELEKLLNVKVDLVSKDGIKPRYLKYIEQDIQYV